MKVKPSRSVTRVAVAALTCLALSAVWGATSALAAPAVLVSDTFTRTTSGWGTASPIGVGWAEFTNGVSGNTGFSTNGSLGLIATPAVGDYRIAREGMAVKVKDLDATFDASVGALPVGGWEKIIFIARDDNADSSGKNYNQYRLYLKVSPKTGTHTMGDLAVGLQKSLSSGATAIGSEVTVCTNCVSAAQTWHVHLQVQTDLDDPSTTDLRLRTWTGSTEPSTWAVTGTDGTAALATSGQVGVRTASGTGLTNSFNVRFDNMHVEDISPPTAPTVTGGSLTWTNAGSETVSASGSVDSGGAPADHYQYRTFDTSAGAWTSPTTGSSDTVTAQGITYVQFRAVDTLGNYSPWTPTVPDHTDTVPIDRTAPTAPTVTGGASAAQHGPVTIDGCCSSDDLEPDSVGYVYRVSTDGGTTWGSAQSTGDGTVQFSTTGDRLVQFASVDGAGNQSAWTPATSDGSNEANVDTSITPPSGTTIAGSTHITTNTDWTLAGSPYFIGDGQVFVDSGVTLTIDPGVVVVGTTIHSQLFVNGTLDAEGTAGANIIFTSADGYSGGGGFSGGAPGDWLGIALNGSGTSEIDYARITYAGNGGADNGSGNIDVTNGTLNMDHDYSLYSETSGLLVDGSSVTPPYPTVNITNSHVDYNDTGIYVSTAVLSADFTTADHSTTRGIAFFLADAASLPRSSFNDGSSVEDGDHAVFIDPDPSLDTGSWPTGQTNFFSSDADPILEIELYDPVLGAWSPNNFGAANTLATGYIPCVNHDARPNYQGIDESGIAFIAQLADSPIPPEDVPMAWTASTNIEVHNDAPPPETCLTSIVDAFGVN